MGITMPVVKHSFLLQSTDDLTRTFREAFYIASTGRPGPVLIDIPSDLSGAEMVFHYPDSVSLPSYKPTYRGNARQVKQAAELIQKAERPLLYAGGGIVTSHACAELTELAERMQIPVVTTLMGKGAMRCSNPLNLGPVGMHGSKYANMAVTECDLLIAVGARFSDRVTGKVSEFAPHAKVIHIDIDPAEIGKIINPVQMPIVGDAKGVLAAINERLAKADAQPIDRAWVGQDRLQLARALALLPPATSRTTPMRIAPEVVHPQAVPASWTPRPPSSPPRSASTRCGRTRTSTASTRARSSHPAAWAPWALASRRPSAPRSAARIPRWSAWPATAPSR